MFIFVKSVIVLVRLPNTRKKSYLKTLIDTSTEALKRSKHWAILRLAKKEKQLLSNYIFKFNKVMSHMEHDIECTPVTDESMSVSKTSTRYAFTPFFFFTSHI